MFAVLEIIYLSFLVYVVIKLTIVISWPCRSADDYRKHGMEWKHAQTLADRDRIGHDHGIRFTELLRLPYIAIF